MAESTYSTATNTCQLVIWDGKKRHELTVPKGSNLRSVLLDHGLSSHSFVTKYLNCGGNGFCATCAVKIDGTGPQPYQWLDKISSRLGHRLSCQVTVDRDMSIRTY